MSIAAAIVGGACVYLSYHPSDSVAVENGDALWFGVIALLLGTTVWGFSLWNTGYEDEDQNRINLLIDAIPWLLAGWMMLAAVATSPPGNLRAATNEAWLWISGAAVFTCSRRLLRTGSIQASVLGLLVVCATGLAVHGLHQQFISLPQSRSEYRENPDKMLRDAGLNAPQGSAERMVFENRLFDGGPTGTFALANSLAAVLLVGVIALLGVLRFRWRAAGSMQRIAVCVALAACLVCFVAVRSRSAVLAATIAVVLLLSWIALEKKGNKSESAIGLVVKGLFAVAALVLALVFGLAAFVNAEWIDQAPASIAFRFQYWRSTLAMTFDRPWFSAGPGNFQSIYLRYREDSASEQIAEPHNFLFETMAGGGMIALVLLIILLAAIAWYSLKRNLAAKSTVETTVDNAAAWVWLGAGVALVLVWLIGAAAGRTPDYSAHLFVIPIVLVLAYLIWPLVKTLEPGQTSLIAAATLVGLLLHLLASGGWTVPGVAIHLWLLAGILTRVGTGSTGSRGWSLAAITLGLLLLAVLRSISLVPVQTAQIALSAFEYSQQRGQARQADAALERAIAADPWSPTAALWRADSLHWRLVREGDSGEIRRSWERYLGLARERAGESPSLWEVIGHQQLHLYQRFGDRRDLAAAEKTFAKVVLWNPADQQAVAQLAVIAANLGDRDRASELANRAEYLSELGDNMERSLERQLIYVPEPRGLEAAKEPILAAASDLLSNNLQ